MNVRNRYKVPKKTWSRWSLAARSAFNAVFAPMINNRWVFQHPKAAPLPKEHWRTTAFNAAWTAADFINKSPMTHVYDDKGRLRKLVMK